MKGRNIKDTLVDRTIKIIAKEGLDKTTTKAIVAGTGISEVYIYRHFSGKEELLVKAFDALDNEIVAKIMQHVPVMYRQDLEYEIRCRFFFTAVWNFLLGNKEKCLAFVRYYYSPYFQKFSYQSHRQRYAPVVKKFEDAFIEEADAWMILNHVLNVILDFAVKVHNDHMPNDEAYVEHVFRVVYTSIRQYFRSNEE